MAIEMDIHRVLRGFRPSGRGDADLAELATVQDGVVDDPQLFALGFGRDAIQWRVDHARLHRIHVGVYCVGHRALSLRGRWRAAVMACGPDALLSHRGAADLWGLMNSSSGLIDVTVPTDRGRRVRGVRRHIAAHLEPPDRDERDGIPCVSVPLTLLDIAAVEPRRRLERACDECEVLRLFDLRAIEELLGRSRGRRGAGRLRAVLADHAIGSTLTRTALEDMMVELAAAADLGRPRVNEYVKGGSGTRWEVDFLWPARQLVPETDGNRFHSTRRAIERDRRKEADLVRVGYRILRATWAQLEYRPEEVVLMLRAALGV